MMSMLEITNLHATVADKPILKGLSLSVNAGEVHAIMGPNCASKSTLRYVLDGREGYQVTEGSVNVGFSGGEKKRNEMVQMGIIQPRLAVLDETDSGLDIDALRVVADGINRIMRAPGKAVLLITHYQRLLDLVVPDFVHVLADGR